VTSTGTTIAAAAAELGVQTSTASYWVRKARKARKPTRRARRSRSPGSATAIAAEPRFVRVVRASETASSIEVWTGKVTIRVRPGFDAELLRAVVAALSEAPA